MDDTSWWENLFDRSSSTRPGTGPADTKPFLVGWGPQEDHSIGDSEGLGYEATIAAADTKPFLVPWEPQEDIVIHSQQTFQPVNNQVNDQDDWRNNADFYNPDTGTWSKDPTYADTMGPITFGGDRITTAIYPNEKNGNEYSLPWRFTPRNDYDSTYTNRKIDGLSSAVQNAHDIGIKTKF